MLRGVVQKWQQPVAFYFCKGATSRIELKKNIKEVVAAVAKTGLLPLHWFAIKEQHSNLP